MSSVRFSPPWTHDLAAPARAPGEMSRTNADDGALLFSVVSLPVTDVEECVLTQLALVRLLCATQVESPLHTEHVRH